jgi:hypothetical protein
LKERQGAFLKNFSLERLKILPSGSITTIISIRRKNSPASGKMNQTRPKWLFMEFALLFRSFLV